jgi:hypothetical protein
MADLLSALREFRYLDEKRLLGALAPAEQQRWEELREVVAPHTQPLGPDPSTVAEPPGNEAPTEVAPVTEVEPPFVDAELTEDGVSEQTVADQTAVGAPADSAFDRSPIPQPPVGAQPMLLEFERPATDFEPTNAAATERPPETDFEPTVAGPLPLTTVAPMALTNPAPEPEPESMTAGIQSIAAEVERESPADEPLDPPEVPPAPPPAPEPTSVIPPSASPWRAFAEETASPTSTPSEEEESAAEADFFKHFGSRAATEPGPLPEPPSDHAEPPPRSWAPPPSESPAAVPVLAPEVSPLAGPPEGVVAPYVPGTQRVVVHTLEGLQTRGFLAETDLTRHAILLRKQDGGEQWLNAEELKAVFFLIGPDQQPSPAQGQRVSVKLRDGRTLLGTALDPGSQAVGFYLYPEDGNARIDRIFLYLAAIKDIAPA